MIASFGTPIATEIEIAVGNAWVQLVAAPTPCQRVILSAPNANHPKAGTNTGNILVCISKTQPTSTAGARTIKNDGSTDRFEHVSDASLIWLRGFNAGDSIEASIQGLAQNQV